MPGTFLRKLRCTVALVAQCVAVSVSAGVFGDGDPANGVEDDRRGVSDGSPVASANRWYRSAGTVVCDGKVRGSATLLDLADLAPAEQGTVIATAAHVFFDLQTGQPWSSCAFHYLGLGQVPGYQASIDPDRLVHGSYDPASDPALPTHGAGDWAFAWLDRRWSPPDGALGLAPAAPLPDEVSEGRLGLVAWDRGRGEVSVTTGCGAVASGPDDLGGGGWAGQLLDDCDSEEGASGGGLVVVRDGRSLLVGIRGGSHWDRQAWPPERHPAGPPPGSRWDPRRHTNYARAFDHDLLARLIARSRHGP